MSVAKMFAAGFLPGPLLCVVLMITVALVGRSIWALLLPFGIITGLRFGLFTPTEAGAVAVVYALFVGAVIYLELKWHHLDAMIEESVVATAFAADMTWEGIPAAFSAWLVGSVSDPIVLLIVVNLLLLFICFFFEGGSAIILMTPLLLPVATQLGIDPVHFGIVMAVNLTIAGFTPPVGTMMFIIISIAKVRMEDHVRGA